MALEAAVSVLMKNLQAILNDKEVNNPRLRKQMIIAKKMLMDVQKLLRDAKENQTTKPSVDKLETSLLKDVYSLDDEVESFLIRTTLQRRKFFAKVLPVTKLMVPQSQTLTRSLKDSASKIDKYLREGSQENKDVGDRNVTQSSISEVDGGINYTDKESEQTGSDKQHGHPDEQSNPNDQPAKAHPEDDQPAGDANPISLEARPNVSERQPMQTPEPNSQQPAAAPSAQHAVEPSAKEPAAEKSSQKPADKPNGVEAGARVSDEKHDVQNGKPQISDEHGAQTTGQNISGEQQAPQQLPSISDRLDDDSDFIGRKVQADELAQEISYRHKLRFLISLVGAAGSGKTTFVRNVYNKADIVQNFQLRAWVNVSEEFPEIVNNEDVAPKTKNLLIDILRQVTAIKEEEKLTLEKLEEKVRDFFIHKRFLIVLDDVKTSIMWESIKRTFPNSLNGSRMIIITRDENIAEQMNDQGFRPFQLHNLDINESWALFLKKVGQKQGFSNESLKQLIFHKCKGLPLAIVVLGGLLSTRDPSSWSENVERIDFGNDPSKAVLALAYQELASELQPCLLYLGLFPKDYEIPVRRLFRLWAAEGLTNPTSESDTPEDLVEKYLQDLIRRNMIEVSKWRLDGSPKRCRVPGILYDNVFPSAAEIGYFNVLRSPKYEEKCVIRRAAAHFDISNPNLDGFINNMHSYISFNTRKGDTPAYEVNRFINKIIGKRGFGLLIVLDLENVYKPVLSETIGKLILLSYLGLRWTFLDSIPNSVGDLPNLETLDVKHTNITSLPISIWNSKKLRHLYMNEIYLDLSLQKPLASGSLGNLLTLWGLIIGNKSPGKDWFNMLSQLTKLGLTCHFESIEPIAAWIFRSTKLMSLKLRSIDEFSRPAELKLFTMNKHVFLSELYLLGKLSQEINNMQLPQSLKMLTLSVSQLENDPMPYLGELPQLKILRLFARSYLGKEMTCHAKGFPELRVLKLWMLEKLEKWTVQEGSMPCLKELEIRRCEKLKETSGLQNLTTLKELTLTNMPTEFVAEIERSIGGVSGRKEAVRVQNFPFAPLPK